MIRLWCLVALVASWTVVTGQRVQVWQDDARVWEDASQHPPVTSLVWINLGNVALARSEYSKASWAYTQARVAALRVTGLERELPTAVAELNLALVAWEQGAETEARTWYRLAVAHRPLTLDIARQSTWLTAHLGSF